MSLENTTSKHNKNFSSPTIHFLHVIIHGVSEFDRQTFRADSMIKNKHKTLNTMWSKMLSLRDNRLKISTSNKRNRVEFLIKPTKIKRSYVQGD
jgi:hypothetical protein